MSFIAPGLRCTGCGLIEDHVFYKRSAGPPACPVCTEKRVVDWSHKQFPGVKGEGYGGFTPVDMGVLGYCDTKEKFDRAKSIIEDRFPGQTMQIEHDTKTDKQTRADEKRHRTWLQRKQNGVDKQLMAETREANKALKRETERKALRLNKNAKAAGESAVKAHGISATKAALQGRPNVKIAGY